jgi:cytochrome bd-type quinol oxidase subunit 2
VSKSIVECQKSRTEGGSAVILVFTQFYIPMMSMYVGLCLCNGVMDFFSKNSNKAGTGNWELGLNMSR